MGAAHPYLWALSARGLRRFAPRWLATAWPLVGGVASCGLGHFVPDIVNNLRWRSHQQALAKRVPPRRLSRQLIPAKPATHAPRCGTTCGGEATNKRSRSEHTRGIADANPRRQSRQTHVHAVDNPPPAQRGNKRPAARDTPTPRTTGQHTFRHRPAVGKGCRRPGPHLDRAGVRISPRATGCWYPGFITVYLIEVLILTEF